jgi:hypothetical protein
MKCQVFNGALANAGVNQTHLDEFQSTWEDLKVKS